MRKIFLTIFLAVFFAGCTSVYDNIPDGFSVYKENGIPFTFLYPTGYNVLITDDTKTLPIVTITSELDPTYYYVITCGEEELANEHFEEVYDNINEEIETQAGGGVLSYDEFFDITEEEVKIGDNNTAIVRQFFSIVPDVYFINSLYKFSSLENTNQSFVFFYSATSDHSNERDIILESLKYK